jgi:hypothetical protein
MSNWILKVTSASMPASCRAAYSVVRVLEVPDGVAAVASVRSKEVIRVVYESGAVPSYGVTERSGIQRALAYANHLIATRDAVEERARTKAIADAVRRAEIAQREHEETLESRRAAQDAIADKLARGERLSPAEFASL